MPVVEERPGERMFKPRMNTRLRRYATDQLSGQAQTKTTSKARRSRDLEKPTPSKTLIPKYAKSSTEHGSAIHTKSSSWSDSSIAIVPARVVELQSSKRYDRVSALCCFAYICVAAKCDAREGLVRQCKAGALLRYYSIWCQGT
jgi:hypothetical protein